MSSRREFMKSTAATVATAISSVPFVQASDRKAGGTSSRERPGIKAAIRRDETVVRHGGNGDIFPLTWTRDDRQFGSFSDGSGWSSLPKKAYNTRAIWVDGGPVDARIQDVDAYPDPSPPDVNNDPPYYGFSVLAVEDRIYQFLCCMQKPSDSGRPWNGVKLIYSPDQGRTWRNQDGSTPVVWEPYANWSRKTLLFVDEPQEAFSLISVLQMGKNYEANRDGYVYGYGTNGNIDGLMNQLVMFRVPKGRILDRNVYEFFGGMKSNGKVAWVKDIRGRAIVHTFPRGWVNIPRKNENVVQAWLPSVAYNTPLNQYLMVSAGVGCPTDGNWFANSKPSYLGFWTAPNPWGPWAQIHEETAWTPGNDAAARCYSPQISPKWIAPDGRSFWLVWSDFQQKCDEGEYKRIDEAAECIKDANEKVRFQLERSHRCMPYYAFNSQLVDLVITEGSRPRD
jgi:hypothetical protein